ncbi:MAG: DNA-binding MarR family transcriptional regulator [Colwellia sp.]|jgi:DNA-binding MarR family transcriptional regulator
MTQFEITNLLLNLPAKEIGLSSTEKCVLIHLSSFIGKSMTCYPSINKLGENSGLSGSTIKRAVAALENKNILKKTRRFSSTGPTSNLYKLNPKQLFKKGQNSDVTIENSSKIKKNSYLGGDGKYYSCPTEYFRAII